MLTDIAVLAALAAGLFVAISVFYPNFSRPAGPAVADWLRLALGAGMYVFPLTLLLVPALILAEDKSRVRRWWAIAWLVVLLTSLFGGLFDGACLRVWGGVGAGTSVLVDAVTIVGSRSRGVHLLAAARFDQASRNLTVTGSAGVPIELPTAAVPSLPSGDYRLNSDDAIRLFGSGVTGTVTWPNHGLRYLAPEGLGITGTLTLAPGVALQMGVSTFITIGGGGALRALGTESQPIRFTSATPGVPGSWVGIQLESPGVDATRLEYVEIDDAGAGDIGSAGALRLWVDPGGVIRHTTIRRSATCGVVLYNGNEWTDDYTDPAFGNVFVDLAGPALCRPL